MNETRNINNLKDLMTFPAKNTPNKDVFRVRTSKTTYRSISWEKFNSDVNALGTAFIEKGLKGAKICVIGENAYEWVLTYMSVICGVGVIIPVDKELSDDEIRNIMIESEATAVVFSKTFENTMQCLKNECLNIEHYFCTNSKKEIFLSLDSMIDLGNELINSGDKRYTTAEINIEDLATILYTSGTTGMSKGVMLSQKNMMTNIKAAASMVYCGKDDVVISILPLHHTYEFSCDILAVFLCEATICFNESLKHLSDNLKLFKPTILFLVPLIAETVYKKIITEATKNKKIKKMYAGIKLSNALRMIGIDIRAKLFSEMQAVFGGKLKKVVVGGAKMNPEIAKKYRDIGILMLQGYGITECAPLVAVNRESCFNDNAVGLVVPCNQVKIKDNEILVKGDNVMLGYYKNDTETKNSFENGWLKTGDLGYVDKDGFLYITGRKKNLIILDNGKNIYPEEIESYLYDIEEISEVVVYEENGVISAAIYSNATTENTEETIKAKICEINKSLPIYKQINSIKFRASEFEKTTTQKIKRYKIGVCK